MNFCFDQILIFCSVIQTNSLNVIKCDFPDYFVYIQSLTIEGTYDEHCRPLSSFQVGQLAEAVIVKSFFFPH